MAEVKQRVTKTHIREVTRLNVETLQFLEQHDAVKGMGVVSHEYDVPRGFELEIIDEPLPNRRKLLCILDHIVGDMMKLRRTLKNLDFRVNILAKRALFTRFQRCKLDDSMFRGVLVAPTITRGFQVKVNHTRRGRHLAGV